MRRDLGVALLELARELSGSLSTFATANPEVIERRPCQMRCIFRVVLVQLLD